MKKQDNKSVRASALRIPFTIALVLISAILLASTSNAAPAINQPDQSCGRIDTADMTAIGQHVIGWVTLTGCPLTAADVVTNGSITTPDWLALQRFYVGFTNGIGSSGTLTGCGLCYGDVVSTTTSPLPSITITLPTTNIDVSVSTTTTTILSVVTTNIDASMGLVGFQGDITFDERVITFPSTAVNSAGITGGSAWTISGHVLPGPGPFRTLRVSAAFPDGNTPLSGSGTLFNLKVLRVSSTPGDMTNLVWTASPDDFEFVHTEPPSGTPNLSMLSPTQNNGLITITQNAPTPTPIPITLSGTTSDCTNPTIPAAPGVTLNLTGTQSGSTLSDGSGNYSFSVPSGGSYTVTPVKALAPGAAPITTTDILAVQRHFLNITPIFPDCRLTAADVNGDGNITTIDVVAIQLFVLGYTTGTGNVGKYQFTPASRAYSGILGNQVNQDYTALVFGDVASPFADRAEGPSPDGPSAGEVPGPVAMLSLPNVAADKFANNFTVPVTTTKIDARNRLVGFQGDFTFDERVVNFEVEPVQKAGLTGGNWNVSGHVLDGDGPIRTLRISAYSENFMPLSGSGTLFELRMRAASSDAKDTQLLWATPPNRFIFIDADLNAQRPINAEPGSFTTTGNRKEK